MRRELDESVSYTNHVDKNIKVVKRLNELNKVVFLSKIKFNIENQINLQHRKNQIQLEKLGQIKA